VKFPPIFERLIMNTYDDFGVNTTNSFNTPPKKTVMTDRMMQDYLRVLLILLEQGRTNEVIELLREST